MKCPACNSWTELLETRKRAAGTYRRYECANMHRFSTINDQVVRVDAEKRSRGRPRIHAQPEPAQSGNWPFPPAGGPTPWTRQQIQEHEQQQRSQLEEAPF